LPQPGTVAGATDQQTVQMFALINAVGADLLTRTQWTALQRQAVINVPQTVTTTGTLLAGYDFIHAVPSFPSGEPSNYIIGGTGLQTSTRATSAGVVPPFAPITVGIDMPATITQIGAPITISQDTFPVPADFVTFINDTQWDRGNHWKMQGPASPQEDEWLRSGIVSTGPRRWFRQVGRGLDVFRIWPPPAPGDQPGPLSYEYLSTYWAQDASATPIAQFTADTDTCVFNDRLMIEGLKWRFFAAKGFDYSTQYALWERQTQVAIARDGGAPVLSMARRRASIFISPANVQDGNFPSGAP
jgi:hypothetical protein